MKSKGISKWLVIVISIAALAFAIWYFLKKSDPNPVSGLKPRVDMSIARISDVTDSTIKMELKALIHNPLPVGMNLKKFNYAVRMNGKTIVEDQYGKALNIEATDSSLLTLPVKIKIGNLRDEGEEAAGKGNDSVDYQFETTMHFEKPFLGKDSLVLKMDKRLPLYRLPQVKLAGYDVKKLGLKEADIIIKIEVKNRNAFSIKFENPKYVMDLGKQKRFAEGAVTGITQVKAKSKDVYEIPLSVSLGKVIKAGVQMIGKGKELPFTFYFKSKIRSESEVLDGSEMNLIMDGELKDIETFQKNLGKK
ncbi:LEA type 2 family protein [Dyadobacter sp. CY261]|uniref:LEA type 2 family protein n=1 Tax=Dyadobacter sp. CY261 TaxID=2907203 RepID=UPI001F3A1C53|nr:LEA type 2 family protein [Dyadobacter sp. CY261]MCF0073370.1 LEA type 2 family protein [Dyadobacter sp. CY261]